MNEVLAAAKALVQRGDQGAMATAIAGSAVGDVLLLDSEGAVVVGGGVPEPILQTLNTILSTGVPQHIEVGGEAWFVEPVMPSPKLVILGAISVADALVPLAAAAGFEVIVIDGRDWLARPDRYPQATSVLAGHPAEMLQSVEVDAGTSIVSFLHEPRLEDEVLIAALRGPANYVGSMGSRRTTKAKLERLAEAGLSAQEISQLRAPIGLNIGAVTPREIAVAVIGQIISVARGVD